jgi:hypothetical protein
MTLRISRRFSVVKEQEIQTGMDRMDRIKVGKKI